MVAMIYHQQPPRDPRVQPKGEGMIIDNESWQPWYVLYILPDWPD